jgi:hypothetical protein
MLARLVGFSFAPVFVFGGEGTGAGGLMCLNNLRTRFRGEGPLVFINLRIVLMAIVWVYFRTVVCLVWCGKLVYSLREPRDFCCHTLAFVFFSSASHASRTDRKSVR